MQSVTWIMSQNQCFVMLTKFYSILFSYRCCVELYIVWNSSDSKEKKSFQAIVMNNKFILYLYLSDLYAMWLADFFYFYCIGQGHRKRISEAFKMAFLGSHHVKLKAKSAWKRIEIPPGDGFEDVIDLQELDEYELTGDIVSIVAVRLNDFTISGKKMVCLFVGSPKCSRLRST